MVKIVIVGGVAGGASAAARARRLDEHAEITLLQSGPDVSFASCGMPYFIGNEITDRSAMSVQTPQTLKSRFNLDVRVNTLVTEIKTDEKMVVATSNGETYSINYDHLILAVGAAPLKPPIPGIHRPGLFALRNLQDMDDIAAWISSKNVKHAVVAGAGFIGLEMVEQLVHRGIKVTLVEMLKQILGPMDEEMAAYLHRDLEARGVTVIVNDGIKEFTADPQDESASILQLASGKVLPTAQMTILGLGVRPDTEVVKKSGIQVGPRGHIIVDDFLKTSVENVWAVGDAVEVSNPILGSKWAVPLAGPANRQGRMAADNIFGANRKYKGTYGVSVVRSFELFAATVGVNEKFLKSQSIEHSVVHVHPNSHAGYYPGASQIHLKLIFDKHNGKIYGAQAVGVDGVEKRIDVIATAMQGNMTVADLAELELCYAPPVGSAKDPVNFAGMVAQNVIDGLASPVQWYEMEGLITDGALVLDVRGPGEVAIAGHLADRAVDIPIDNLRARVNELPRDKRIVVTCASGQRAYYASRILRQHGFENVDYLTGAFATFHPVHPKSI